MIAYQNVQYMMTSIKGSVECRQIDAMLCFQSLSDK